jgi:hypothetical protein
MFVVSFAYSFSIYLFLIFCLVFAHHLHKSREHDKDALQAFEYMVHLYIFFVARNSSSA